MDNEQGAFIRRTIRLEAEVMEHIRALAKEENRSVNKQMAQLIGEGLAARESYELVPLAPEGSGR